MKSNKQMKIPGLVKLRSIGATSSDLKEQVNQLQREKRHIRQSMYNKQDEINILIKEVEKLERIEKF